MTETAEARLKRLKMRSMRRGMKEMDLVLSRFCDDMLPSMSDEQLTQYDALLSENDQDLLSWVIGQNEPPLRFSGLIAQIAAHAKTKTV